MIKRNIPNAITCGNLLCGCLAIVKCFEGDLVWAAYLVGIAAVLDFFDGFAARLLKVTSAIGKDLDSLADMVTFGVVPGLVMYKLIMQAGILSAALGSGAYDTSAVAMQNNYWPAYIAFVIPIISAVRLAKFNNDTRQSESFIGLPTPANGILICSLSIIASFHKGAIILALFSSPLLLCALCILLSFLLVAELPLFALKFKHFKWKGNEIRFLFLLWSVALMASLQFIGVPLVILSYIFFSLVNNWLLKPRPRWARRRR
jgi:CDP-diacylglycerol---serine O-phosphatidyltransferase